MAVDDALLGVAGRSTSARPALRLYRWDPPCLSLGRFQSTAGLDRDRLATLGWDVVRRPTGGRAIVHWRELTYAVVLPPGHPLASTSIRESYRILAGALLRSLDLLGARPTLAPARGGREPAGGATEPMPQHSALRTQNSAAGIGPLPSPLPAGEGTGVSAPGTRPPTPGTRPPTPDPRQPGLRSRPDCFAAPSDYELVHDGRKLVGSAQVRRDGALLQHGSILLGEYEGPELVFRFPAPLAPPSWADTSVRSYGSGTWPASQFGPSAQDSGLSPDHTSRITHHASPGPQDSAVGPARAASLAEVLGRVVSPQEVAGAVVRGFAEAFGIGLEPDLLSEEEAALAAERRRETYSSEDWTYAR